MKARTLAVMILAALALLLPEVQVATAKGDDLVAGGAWVSLPLRLDEPARAYFSIQNRGSDVRKIVGASSPRAERVEIHRTVFQDGRESSEKLKEWELPKGGTVMFADGGTFLVLYGAKDLKEGEKIEVALSLDDGSKLKMQAVVKDE